MSSSLHVSLVVGPWRGLVTKLAFLFAIVTSTCSFGQSSDKANGTLPKTEAKDAGTTKLVTLQETIDRLKSEGKADEAAFMTKQQERARSYAKIGGQQKWGVIFGRLVTAKSDDPRLCDAQMPIHTSGWFVADVGEIDKAVEFRMWGYHPVRVKHGGRSGETVNVGDIVLETFPSKELATVRAELQFEGKVDPAAVSVNVFMEHPPVNSMSGGTDGFIASPEKEGVAIGPDLRIQKAGLTPIPHYMMVKAPGHLPFYREFKLKPGGTTDLGILKIATSPAFEVEFAIADGLDFSKAERRKQTVYVGDLFQTNPAGKEWVEAGTLKIQEKKQVYSFHCGLAFLNVTDLGVGNLDDYLQPVPKEQPRGQMIEATPIVDGHVYLLTHSMKKMWKHATLMKVKMPPKL